MQNSHHFSTTSILKHLGLLILASLVLSACGEEQTRHPDHNNRNNQNNHGHTDQGGGLGADGKNACGGTSYLDADPGRQCGGCGTGNWECVDGNKVACFNDRGCNGPIVEMLGHPDVTARTATLNGAWESEGKPPATSLGFCLAVGDRATTRPTHESGADCLDVELPAARGSFTGTANELLSGTKYTVAPFAARKATDSKPTQYFYGRAIEFITRPAAPQNVTAVGDLDGILVSWDPVVGAESYLVYRNDMDYWHIAELDASTTETRDETAHHGFYKAPNLEVTNSETEVILTWGKPEPTLGEAHRYHVIAVGASDVHSIPSDEATGNRLATPFTDIEVIVINRQQQHNKKATFSPDDAVNETFTWTDPEAEPAKLIFGTTGQWVEPTVADATAIDHVLLKSVPATTDPLSTNKYYLKILHGEDHGLTNFSAEIPGQRTPGTITHHWERSNLGENDYSPIDCDPDVACEDCDPDELLFCADATASPEGTSYNYRLIASASEDSGAEPVTSTSKTGARAVPEITFIDFSGNGAVNSQAHYKLALENQRNEPLNIANINISMTVFYERNAGASGSFSAGDELTDANGIVTFAIDFDRPGKNWLEATLPNGTSFKSDTITVTD